MEPLFQEEERIFKEQHGGLGPNGFVRKMGGVKWAKRQLELFAEEERKAEEERRAKLSPLARYAEDWGKKVIGGCFLFGSPPPPQCEDEETGVMLNYYYSVMDRIRKGLPEVLPDTECDKITEGWQKECAERKSWKERELEEYEKLTLQQRFVYWEVTRELKRAAALAALKEHPERMDTCTGRVYNAYDNYCVTRGRVQKWLDKRQGKGKR